MSRTWEGRLVGTVDEAAAICGGVKPGTYRYYRTKLGAPGVVTHNPDTGLQEYDLDAVRAWHAARPGKGARTDLAKKRRSTT